MIIPLAEQLRPSSLLDVVGQEHLLSAHGLIPKSICVGTPKSIILWGPPGCGKTTIARLYANAFGMRFEQFSAVFSGIADLRKVINEVRNTPLFSSKTVLFVDEIHRFNKAQQDGFLPYIEKGTFVLIGATTENPSFHLNNALLSRVQVLELKSLDLKALKTLLQRYEEKKGVLPLTDSGRGALLKMAHGDGRYLYNLIETVALAKEEPLLDENALAAHIQDKPPLYDRAGDQHYSMISALHKSVRGSDPDAALYWLCRMLEGGEEPLFLARRIIRMAIEDIGLADPNALQVALNARESYHMLGSPEGELAIAEAVLYMALAPKSNATYTAYKKAVDAARKSQQLPPPKHILNAPTRMMENLEYGKGYQYDHDVENAFSGQNYFPENMERERYYNPVELGFEREMCKRLSYFEKLRAIKNK